MRDSLLFGFMASRSIIISCEKKKITMKISLENTRYMQYIAAATAALSSFSMGMMISWPSPTLPLLQGDDSPIGVQITDEAGSWIVSTLSLSSIPACIITGWSVDRIGRKNTLLLTAFFILISWIMIIFANSVWILIIARAIAGVGMGAGLLCQVIYAAEVSEEDIRGKVGSFLMLLKAFGTVIVLVVGPYVSYTVLAIICACIPIIFFCSFIFLPETPFYYVKINRIEEARNSLRVLSKRNASEKFIEDRLEFIGKVIEEDMKNKGSYKELLTSKDYRFMIFLLFGVKSMQQFNGSGALQSYLQPIINASNSGFDPKIASIIVGCIQLPAVILSAFLVDKLGRKPLLLISTIGCAIALCGEGTYFLLKEVLEKDTSSIGWLPTAGLGLFWICNPIGMLSLPYILLGELFPTNIKGPAVGLATLYGGLTSFLVAKFFQPLSNAIGMYSVFYIFTGICVAGALFVLVFLPETKGKNFQEIQDMIQKKRKRLAEEKDAANLS